MTVQTAFSLKKIDAVAGVDWGSEYLPATRSSDDLSVLLPTEETP